MKYLLLLCFLSCTKESFEKESCFAVTMFVERYKNGVLTERTFSWGDCRVCGEDLKRFQAYPPVTRMCEPDSALFKVELSVPCSNTF
jgi:hypothetical protein